VRQKDFSIHALAVRLGTWVAKSSGQPDRGAILSYGAEVILGSITKIFLLVIISKILGILSIMAIMVLTAGSLRLLAGGAHCTAYYRCLIFSLLIFSVSGIALQVYLPYLTSLNSHITFIPILICLMINLKWAPHPPENKPLANEEDRFSRKLGSIMYCLAVFTVICLLGKNHWWIWPCLAGIFLQSISITPWGVWLISGFDRVFSYRLTRKEVESNG